METKHLHIGGLIAVGFDASGKYLLTVSHSGRGLFQATDWTCIAREHSPAYPDNARATGIGPVEGESIPVVELDSDHSITLQSPCGRFTLRCESSVIEIVSAFGGLD